MSTAVGAGPGDSVAHASVASTGLASRVMVLLFTDVAGSTQLKEQLGMPAYARLISRHDAIFKEIVDSLPGAVILQDSGDGFLARFATPSDAVTAALRFQLALTAPEWGEHPLRVRIGLHLGQMTELEPTRGAHGAGGHAKVVGVGADMAARVMRLAVPGQILMTRGAFDEARQYLRQRRRATSGVASKTPAPVEPTPAPAPAEPETAEDPWHLGLEIGPRDEDDDDTSAGAGAGVNASADAGTDSGVGVSPAAEEELGFDELPPLEWIAHGRYLISGHDEPIEVFEVGVRGRSPLQTPPDGEKARRAVSFDEEPTLGWRPAVGREIPRRPGWVLQRPLGGGAFGEVWLARHPRTKDRRVFKFCFDADHLRSLKRELTLFRLLHEALGDRPDVAKLHEVQLEHPPFFLESEFSELGSLSDWATTRGGIGRISLETRLDLVARVAEAVAAAHSIGILHKDIKPGNILIYQAEDRSPRPRLADFGVASLTDASGLARFAITVSALTRSLLGGGTFGRGLTGTPMYQPPELEAGKPFTIQGDVFALGVLLYQMVIGDLRRPLAEGWERDVEDPLLREDIAACVEGDPARRLASATDLSRRLRELDDRRDQRALMEAAALASARRRRLYRLSLGASIGLVVLLLAESATSSWYISRIRREQALKEIARDEAVRNFVSERRSRADSFTREGTTALDNGDPARALLWFVEAMEVDAATKPIDPAREAAQRLRVAMAFRTFPRLLDVPPPGNAVLDPLRASGGSHGGRMLRAVNDGRRKVFTARFFVPAGKDGDKEKDVPTPWPMKHEEEITHCSLSADGLRVATASKDRTARVWDAKTGRPLTPPLWHDDAVVLATFLPGAPHILITATHSGTPVRLWDLSTLPGDPASTRALRHARAVVCVAFSRDGRRVVTGSWDSTGRVWDPVTGAPVTPPLAHEPGADRGPPPSPNGVLWVAFSPDGRKVVTTGDDGTARLWDATTGAPLLEPLREESSGAVVVAAFSPDGTKLLTGSHNGAVCLWDTTTGRLVIPPIQHGAKVPFVAFSPDGSLFATASHDKTAGLWQTATGAPALPKTIEHDKPINHVAFSPDGRILATASDDMWVRLWSTSSGRAMTKVPLRHDGEAKTAEFSADGTRLVTTSRDFGVRLWDTSPNNRGEFLKRMGHQAPVNYATFSGDGSMVLSVGYDGAGRLWSNNKSGRALSPALAHGGEGGELDSVYWAAFAPPPPPAPGESAGAKLRPPVLAVTGGRDGTARLWDLTPDSRPLEDIKKHAELLARHHIDDTESYRRVSVDQLIKRWDYLRGNYPQHFKPNPPRPTTSATTTLATPTSDPR